MSDDLKNIQDLVRKAYGGIANGSLEKSGDSCGCGCGDGTAELSRLIGYTDEELAAPPRGSKSRTGLRQPHGYRRAQTR